MNSKQFVNSVVKKFPNSYDRTLSNISTFYKVSELDVARAFHIKGYTNGIIDFIGSDYVPKYIQYLYQFLITSTNLITIEINKKYELKDGRTSYLQIYIKEKKTCILVDYDLPKTLIDLRVIKLNKKDFYDIFSLSRIKLLLTKKLCIPMKFLDDIPFNSIDYIEQNKNISPDLFREKLYFNMLNTIMIKNELELNEMRKTIENNLNHPREIIKLKENINNTTQRLKNIIMFFDT